MLSITKMPVAKLFVIITFCGLLMYIILAFYVRRSVDEKGFDLQDPKLGLKYILFDTYTDLYQFKEGQQLFEDYNCPEMNCYMTTNNKLLIIEDDFDAVVVNVTEIAHIKLPPSRPKNQRYVFFGMEPSDQTPVCRLDADNFFDYTWSYKLSSDIVSPFFVVRDENGTVVAPSLNAKWAEGITKSSLKDEDKLMFKNKSKAVAMIVRSCLDKDGKIFANKLREALRSYSDTLDVFGCERTSEGIDDIIVREYFFVLVTSGSAARDYVTDKVLKAYWNNAVPIVRARADLNEFLPPGSYINARLQTPDQIAALVHYSISSPPVYRSFFRWRNFYTFHRRREFDGICQLCKLLHSRPSHSRSNLREWWEPRANKKCAKN